jgi:hypothetical protein
MVCRRPVYLPRNNRPFATLTRALAMSLACWSVGAGAQELIERPPAIAQEDPGQFEVRSANVQLDDGVYYLNAWIEYRLSYEARDALRSGVPLRLRLDVQLLANRRFWFDAEDAELRQLYQLEYHALSERYIVENLNSGDVASFGSLFAALDFLGRVEHLPVIDAALLDRDREYDIRMRAALDVEKLPGPLRLLAFWRRDYSLASDWFKWRLQGD